ncbi:hypothetical protein BAV1858, partial [Bordetella avium 197N]
VGGEAGHGQLLYEAGAGMESTGDNGSSGLMGKSRSISNEQGV